MNYAGLAGGALVAAVLVFLLRWILLPFVVSLIVAYLCAPLVGWLARSARLPRAGAAVLVFAAVTATAFAACWLAIAPLARELQPVVSSPRSALETLVTGLLHGQHFLWMGRPVDGPRLAAQIAQVVESRVASGSAPLMWLSSGVAAVFGVFLSWVLLGYFLIGGPALARGALWLVPPGRRPFVSRVWRELNPVLRRYFVGVALVIVYAACAAYLGLGVILGLHHALLLAVLTGFLELIPLVGPAASAVMAGLAALREASNPWGLAGYVVYAFMLRLSIDQLFGPLVLGRAGALSPVVVLFSFIVGAALYGVLGVILAVPCALAIRATLAAVYAERPVEAR
jgi:predicted PurR-regulated permease PerM